MIRARAQVLLDPLTDGILVAPGYKAIHQTVAAAASEIIGSIAEP